MKSGTKLCLMLGVSLIVAASGGCRGERTNKPPRQFFPDMDDQPKYKAQRESTFFADGRSMRQPVRGTVPFGPHAFTASFMGHDFADRAGFLKDDPVFFTGMEQVVDEAGRPVLEADGTPRRAYVLHMPIEKDDKLLALGEKQYNIFCIACHSGVGDGKGTVGNRWSYPLPSFHAEQYQYGGEKGQDGYLFHTILNGVPNVGENVPYPNKMPPYRSKVSEREAWAIVAYIRALQASRSAPLESIPERERLELERRRGASQTNAGAAGDPHALAYVSGADASGAQASKEVAK